jgi:hypothetical protein
LGAGRAKTLISQTIRAVIQDCIQGVQSMRSRRRKGPSGPSQSHDSAANIESSETARHLSNIDKLLSAAFDLMKQTPSIDSSAFEQLRQLRVRIRYALSGEVTDDTSALPTTAPALYKERKDKEEGPIAFTKRVYSRWLGKKICRSDLKMLDKKLYNALYNLDDPTKKFEEIGLLTKKELNDMLLKSVGKLSRPSITLKMLDLPPIERERARLFNLARRRKQRSAKS